MTRASFRVQPTRVAAGQIVAQADYYREKSGTPLATRWRLAVKQAVASLRTMPNRGEPCLFKTPALQDVRRIEVAGFDRFSLFYRVDAERGTVLILMVVHEARNIEVSLRNQT